ncbi:MAG: HAD hydrolase family protein [Salinivirgaceae bacterium]|nr:HAD hydrolase family protein [Salinivirgaceae bacterium]
MSNFKEDLMKVKAFAFDIDGVCTDATMICLADGQQVRQSNTRDGFALRFAHEQGYPIAIISAGKNNAGVVQRFKSLGLTDLYIGDLAKVPAFDAFLKRHNLTDDDVLYMGDDVPDYPILKRAGVPTCPADATNDIKPFVKYVSEFNGGHGCVRDVIEQVLRAQGRWVNFETENFL